MNHRLVTKTSKKFKKAFQRMRKWYQSVLFLCLIQALFLTNRSSHPEMFLGKGVLEIYSKFTGEHPCQSAISIKLQSNFTEIILRHMFSCKFATYFRTTFFRNTSGRLLLNEVLNWNYFDRSYQCHSNVRFTNTNIKKPDVFLNENSLFK